MISEDNQAVARKATGQSRHMAAEAKSKRRIDSALGPFTAASPKCQSELRLALTSKDYSKGERLVCEGERFNDLPIVSAGAVELFKELPGERREVVGFRFPGEVIAVPERGATWPVNLRAVSDCRLSSIGLDELRHLAQLFPEIDEILLRVVSGQLADSFDLLTAIGRRRPEEKVAYFLLDVFDRSANVSGDGIITLPMNRPEIADYLGLRTETVCRILTRLKNTGLLALPSAKRVVLRDRPALEALSRGIAAASPGKPGRQRRT